MIPLSTARIAGSYLCDWGYSGDPGNPGCENVALPGYTLCPAHERISNYLESVAAQCPDDWDQYEHGEWEPTPGWTEDDRIAAMGPAPDPEHCPVSPDHRHSESWYDCEPCTFCKDDSPPEQGCDCGRPDHKRATV